jgi:peptide/nickel transport system substrate-binding protein
MADSGFGAIQSPRSIQDAADGKLNPTGTGAFKFARWTPGQELVLEANPGYWDRPPAVERIIMRPIPEAQTRVNLLETGEAHVVSQVPPQDLSRLRNNTAVRIDVPATTSWQYIALDNQKPPFDDLKVRQALNSAVDKQQIVDRILFGVGRVADSPIGSGYRMHVAVGAYAYDPNRARQLLAEAGWKAGADGILEKDGRKLSATLLAPTGGYAGWSGIVQAVQSYAKAVGIDVKILEQEWATYLQTSRKAPSERQFEMALLSWGTADPDSGMGLTLRSKNVPPTGSNVALYKNARVDDNLDKGGAAIKLEERMPFYKDAQETVMQDAPWLFLAERREAVGIRSNVQGVAAIPSSAGLIDLVRTSIAS